MKTFFQNLKGSEPRYHDSMNDLKKSLRGK